MARCISSLDSSLIKPPSDKRIYRLIELENGLSAMLIHDPEIYPEGPPQHSEAVEEEKDLVVEHGDEEKDWKKEAEEIRQENEDDEELEGGDVEPKKNAKGGASQTKKAAAAMCVGIGSFSDPLEAQGLAHFLEHMLFMGTTEFPEENELDSYLSKRGGGYSNAHTEIERTIYHFEVKREFLKGALRRFAQLFISPLMKAEAMEREVMAVDSEYNGVLQNDFCRLEQLQCHTAAPGHPFNKFYWGSKKSLLDAMDNGINNLRERLLNWYRDYYHGGLMKLVVIGGESVDVLEDWVVELFSNVKKGPQGNLKFKVDGPIWKGGKLYRLQAIKDAHMLYISWTLPCLQQHFLKKPDDYLAHILGHEGRGSLHHYLKARGWISHLGAGSGEGAMHHSSLAFVFDMNMRLTDSGLEKVFDIIGVVYQYIKLLRQVSPQEWIFRELQAVADMDFKFSEEPRQCSYAVGVASNLQLYPPEYVLYGEYAHDIWDEELINYVLGFFTPENMRVDVLSKSSIKSEDFQCEPWFGSHYTEEDLPRPLMDLWKDPPEIDVSLHLPSKNEFIPSDFSIRSDNLCLDSANISLPKCIVDEPLMKLWYKLDSTFKLPRVNTYFRINLKGVLANVKTSVMTELYIRLLKDGLNEIIYQANVARLDASISVVGDKMELMVCGFNDKLPVLLPKLLATAKSFFPTDDRFKVIIENMKRRLKNTNMTPMSHCSFLRQQILWQTFYDPEDRLKVVNELSISDLKSFIPELCSQVHTEGICHGNLSEEEAINVSNIFKMNLMTQPLPIELRHKEHVICLPPRAKLVRDATVKNRSETNSVLELYYQIEQEVGTRMKVVMDLFNDIIGEPFFDQLRTKEQLGYGVSCSPHITFCVSGYTFCIQSSEYSPIYLQGRIESFINGLEQLLEELDDDSFENYRSGLMARQLEKDLCLTSETDRYWYQIKDKRYIYDLALKEAEELRSIHKEDVINWYKTYLQPSSPKCRRLVLRVWGCNTDLKEAEARSESEQIIEDPVTFKMSSSFYPSIC